MKLTGDRFFFDSNILIYAHSDVDLEKQQAAHVLITCTVPYVSTQVCQEVANNMVKKYSEN